MGVRKGFHRIGWLSRLFFGGLWRLYQIALMFCGMMLFYWAFDIRDSSDVRDYVALWMMADIVFAVFFTWVITILTRWTLDRLNAASSNQTFEQNANPAGDETPSPEGFQRLGVGDQPDDLITLRPKDPR